MLYKTNCLSQYIFAWSLLDVWSFTVEIKEILNAYAFWLCSLSNCILMRYIQEIFSENLCNIYIGSREIIDASKINLNGICEFLVRYFIIQHFVKFENIKSFKKTQVKISL